MTPDPKALAGLHKRSFTLPRPWSAAEIATLLADPAVFLCTTDHGFALGRTVLDEAELLTLAVDPDHRRKGLGAALLCDYHHQASQRGTTQSFLEVAADNVAALGLYLAAGYTARGRRPRYYSASGAEAVDAVVMRRELRTEGSAVS